MRKLDDGTTKLPLTYWEISWIVVYGEKVNSKSSLIDTFVCISSGVWNPPQYPWWNWFSNTWWAGKTTMPIRNQSRGKLINEQRS